VAPGQGAGPAPNQQHQDEGANLATQKSSAPHPTPQLHSKAAAAHHTPHAAQQQSGDAAYSAVEQAVEQLETALNAAKPKTGAWEMKVLLALRQHMLAAVCMCVRVCVCFCVRVCARVCVCMCVRACACVLVFAHACSCECTCTCVDCALHVHLRISE